MSSWPFPAPRFAPGGPEGVVRAGLTEQEASLARSLYGLYSRGAFPMAEMTASGQSRGVHWCVVDPRAMLPLSPERGLHIPRRLARTMRRVPYRITTDAAFEPVVRMCGKPGRNGAWIDEEIMFLACLLHRAGHAHSIEAWDDEGRLVGGLYGVSVRGRDGPIFCAESMVTDFEHGPDAGKICLMTLAHHLDAMKYAACDVQMANPNTERFGVYEISREQHEAMLSPADEAAPEPCPWRPLHDDR